MTASACDKNEKTRFRLCCFTIFDMSYDFTKLQDKLQYYAYGKEIAPSTGQEHYQCFGYSDVAQRWTWWKKLLAPHHFEQCHGTLEQNDRYCRKEGQFTEWGQKPMGNGKKRTLAVLAESVERAAAEGLPLCEVVTQPEVAATYIQYHNGIAAFYDKCLEKKARTVDKNFAPEVHYIWGLPGTGKTRSVQQLEPSIYDIPADDGYKWKDGYSGEEAVLYDNVDPKNITAPSRFLKEIDRYFILVPKKGGHIAWRPRRIYITSVMPPDLFALQAGFSLPAEFTRRVTKITHMV